ncbi:MAG: HD domain-containing protein [Flavobacteriaceae bacterium]|nr:HD domain-containing protein [Flavobacteriaceae bacterium]
MNEKEKITRTKIFVQDILAEAEKGHDWSHTLRVYTNALLISKGEEVDAFVVQLAALLHDIADSKFHNGNEEVGPLKARNFLQSISIDQEIIAHVENIIRYMSFKNTLEDQSAAFSSPELEVVRDADRLDAIGAIGIARTFHFGGYKNRSMYDPEIPPQVNQSKEAYKKSSAPTINHFYEKLLLLKDMMHTPTAKKLAEERHDFMLTFLEQFFKEWNG